MVCTLELKPRDADPVYAEVPGMLEEINVKPGQQVKTGDKLGRLSNIDLALKIRELESEIARTSPRAAALARRTVRAENDAAVPELAEVEKSLASLHNQLKEKLEDEQRLELVARPTAPCCRRPRCPRTADRRCRAAQWSGTPLDKKNLGAYLGPRRCIARSATRTSGRRIWSIDQDDDSNSFAESQEVAIKLDELPYQTFHTEIVGDRSGDEGDSATTVEQVGRRADEQIGRDGQGTADQHHVSGAPGRSTTPTAS